MHDQDVEDMVIRVKHATPRLVAPAEMRGTNGALLIDIKDLPDDCPSAGFCNKICNRERQTSLAIK